MPPLKKSLILLSSLIALFFIAGSFYVQSKNGVEEQLPYKKIIPTVGAPGSEHSHMAMVVFINDKIIDFADAKYQLQSPLIHFEDGNGSFVHKHATGITLPYFFKTLSMRLDSSCLVTRDGASWCSNATNTLSIFINGVQKNRTIDSYELREGDKILVNYGADDSIELRAKMNALPTLPSDLSKTDPS